MHLLLPVHDSEDELVSEISACLKLSEVSRAKGLFQANFKLQPGESLPPLAFVRQLLPNAQPVSAASIRTWAEAVASAIISAVPEEQPWQFQVQPHYNCVTQQRMGARAWHTLKHKNSPKNGKRIELEPTEPHSSREAGRHRSELVRHSVIELLRDRRRRLVRTLRREPKAFSKFDTLVQVLLTSPENGFMSIARAPLPFEQRHLIWPFGKGELSVASDKSAPSRAFAKLLEAETRMGKRISRGDLCVDLGAAPGSWTYVALGRQAEVIAVDRSPLREDLMRHPRLRFERGDAFNWSPPREVDWLLCDVIAAPEASSELLVNWLRRHLCRHFVVTLKVRDSSGLEVLSSLKSNLRALASETFVLRLCANKKEVAVFGTARG